MQMPELGYKPFQSFEDIRKLMSWTSNWAYNAKPSAAVTHRLNPSQSTRNKYPSAAKFLKCTSGAERKAWRQKVLHVGSDWCLRIPHSKRISLGKYWWDTPDLKKRSETWRRKAARKKRGNRTKPILLLASRSFLWALPFWNTEKVYGNSKGSQSRTRSGGIRNFEGLLYGWTLTNKIEKSLRVIVRACSYFHI